MADADDQLQAVLRGYDNFLRDKDLTPPKHRPYLVRWVQQFLRFARTRYFSFWSALSSLISPGLMPPCF